MNKLIRLYNQNRIQVIVITIIIIFIITIIGIINSFEKEKIKRESENVTEDINEILEEKEYNEESNSLVSGDSVEEKYKVEFGKLIDTFLIYCKNGKNEEAYDLLTEECKEILYPTVEIFQEQYCKNKFKDGKEYTFQSWTSSDTYIYQVKFFDNILSSGIANNKSYIEDYYSVVRKDEEYKLNINKYIGRVNRNKNLQKNKIDITINYSDVFMDYENFNIIINNNTENTICLNSKEETNEVYVSNKRDTQFKAFINELMDEDLILKPQERKELNIKFSNVYNEKLKMEKLSFKKIISQYDEYVQNKENYDDYVEIEIEL